MGIHTTVDDAHRGRKCTHTQYVSQLLSLQLTPEPKVGQLSWITVCIVVVIVRTYHHRFPVPVLHPFRFATDNSEIVVLVKSVHFLLGHQRGRMPGESRRSRVHPKRSIFREASLLFTWCTARKKGTGVFLQSKGERRNPTHLALVSKSSAVLGRSKRV